MNTLKQAMIESLEHSIEQAEAKIEELNKQVRSQQCT